MKQLCKLIYLVILIYSQNLFAFCKLYLPIKSVINPDVSCQVGACVPVEKDTEKGLCLGFMPLTAKVNDQCSSDENLIWEYKIDLNNDGKGSYTGYDLIVSRLSKKDFNTGILPLIIDNPFAEKIGQPFNATGNYPIGTHKICWKIENECKGVSECCKIFQISICRTPNVRCLTSPRVFQISSTGCVNIWAMELDGGSTDYCGSNRNLKYYFDDDINKKLITMCCENFITAQTRDVLNLKLNFWVEDEEGNKDYCVASVNVEDQLDICCILQPSRKIAGEVKTNKGELVNSVNLDLFHDGNLINQGIGSPYSFGDLVLNKTYVIIPTRNDDHLNGVSTQDLTIIKKHVLGKSKISNPYLLIAADVNDSKSITAADISEIRRLILGEKPEFSKVQSWTFVPTLFQFADPENPWNAPRLDSIQFSKLNTSETRSLDFFGIKMGDVSENARASNLDELDTRNSNSIQVQLSKESIANSDEILVHLSLLKDTELAGIQFTFEFENSYYSFIGAGSDIFSIDDENFGLSKIDQGLLTVSCDKIDCILVNRNLPFLSFRFKKLNPKLGSDFRITSAITNAEIYSQNESFSIKSLYPNFSDYASFKLVNTIVDKSLYIDFNGIDCEVIGLTVYGLNGYIPIKTDIQVCPGMNRINLENLSQLTRGVFLIELKMGSYTYTEPFIRI